VAPGLYISCSPVLPLARVLFTVSSSYGLSYTVVLYVNAFLWMDGTHTSHRKCTHYCIEAYVLHLCLVPTPRVSGKHLN
jgi:hypothetical protein